jgi:hypothetical protein
VRTLVRARGVGVELGATQIPLGRDEVCRHALADEARRITRVETRARGVLAHARTAHGHAAHRLDAAGDHDVLRARHDGLRRKVHRLLAGAALAVYGGRRHVRGQPRCEPGHAPRRACLLARLTHTTADHVVHGTRIELVAQHQLLQHLRQQVHRMYLRERPIGLGPPHGAANRIDDDRSFHRDTFF